MEIIDSIRFLQCSFSTLVPSSFRSDSSEKTNQQFTTLNEPIKMMLHFWISLSSKYLSSDDLDRLYETFHGFLSSISSTKTCDDKPKLLTNTLSP